MVAHSATERHHVIGVLGGALTGVAIGVGYLLLADPHNPSVAMPTCPTKLVTGFDCPACGGLRMAHSILHGDWARALHDNAYLVVALPAGTMMLLMWANRQWRGIPWRPPRWVAWSFLATAALWAVVRNLPGWPWPPT